MVTVKELSLGQRAGIAVDFWRRGLSDCAAALLDELRATTEDERRRAASSLLPVHALALVIAEEVAALQAEVNALLWKRSDGWRAEPAEARRLAPDELVAGLVVVGDPGRVLSARLPRAKRLLPLCEHLGLFGPHARAIACLVETPSAKNCFLAHQEVRRSSASRGGAAPRSRINPGMPSE